MNSWLRRHLTRRRKDDKKEKSAKQEGKRMNYEEKLQIIQAGCPKLRFSAQFTDQSSQWNYSRHLPHNLQNALGMPLFWYQLSADSHLPLLFP